MKNLFGLVVILFVFGASAQDSTGIRLIEKSKIELDSTAYWNMDVIGNHLVSLNGPFQKLTHLEKFATLRVLDPMVKQQHW